MLVGNVKEQTDYTHVQSRTTECRKVEYQKNHMSSQGDGGEVLRSPHLVPLQWQVVLCGFVSCNKLGIATQHESDFTYGKATWDLDPTAMR